MKQTLWHKTIHPITGYFRKKRGKLIKKLFPEISNYNIADVGGSAHFWEKTGLDIDPQNITIYNISAGETQTINGETSDEYNLVIYDGKKIPVEGNKYDLVICNSVIEHVSEEDRENLICEMKRVGRCLYLQTPAYEFPIEPHFIMPFVHWLPRTIGRQLVSISPWRLLSRANIKTVEHYFWGTSLLTYDNIIDLLPDCVVYREKFMGLTKSYIVVCKNNQK